MQNQVELKNRGLSHPSYRPDIDGLRAVAILLVVIFHTFPFKLTGGFIGVDIFFVISGFLISTIIFQNLDTNSFSFTEFYYRRIKRIFPALLTVLFFCIAVGWYILLFDEYKQLGKHIVTGIAYVANFAFWLESGYFDNNSDTKPLLHLWSLSIEEQFYIIWPFLAWWCWRKKFNLFWIIISLLLISLLLNAAIVDDQPIQAFYAPYSRFWELSIGTFLAFINLYHPVKIHQPILKHTLSLLGPGLILIGLFFISRESHFPGWWAILPTVGAAVIIFTGPSGLVNRFVLANPVMIGIGLISYPLYLWHWPLLVFTRIADPGGFAPFRRIAIIAIAVILSWLTYQFLEKPIRRQMRGNNVVYSLLSISVMVISVGAALFTGILQPRNNDQVFQEVYSAIYDTESAFPQGLVSTKFENYQFYASKDAAKENITFLFGDSHIQQYTPRLAYLTENKNTNTTKIFSIAAGCPPIPNVYEDDIIHRYCGNFIDSSIKYLENPAVSKVVIGACWNCYFIEMTQPADNDPKAFQYYYLENGVKEYFRGGKGKQMALIELKKFLMKIARNKKVILILDNPFGSQFDPKSYLKGDRLSNISFKKPEHSVALSSEVLELNKQLISIAREANVEIINPINFLCSENNCPIKSNENQFIYRDNNHIRPSYAKYKLEYLDSILF
jgi:peptidoglycan/LPS O-acetylase OafA/YrhL